MVGEQPEEAEKALRDLSNDYSLSVSEKVTHQAWIAVNSLLQGFQGDIHLFVKLLTDRACNNLQFLNALQVSHASFLKYIIAGILLDGSLNN